MSRPPRIVFLTTQLEYDGTYPDLLCRAAIQSAERHGCSLLVVPGRGWGTDLNDEGIITAVYRLLPSWGADAAIISPPVTNLWGEELLARAAQTLAPLKLVAMAVPIGDIPRVDVDTQTGLSDLIRHLVIEHGRKRIVCLRGPRNHAVAEERYQVWRQVLAEAGLAHDDSLVREVEFKEAGVDEIIQSLLESGSPFDALVAASDLVALEAIRVLQNQGLRVPQDVAVVGYDDLPLSAQADVPLSTVAQDIEGQVEAAFLLALTLAEGKIPAANPLIHTRMVLRQSCGCLSAAESPRQSPTIANTELLRRLERLATFNMGLGVRKDEAAFHQWLAGQLPHHGFRDSILALVAGTGQEAGYHIPEGNPQIELPWPPSTWLFPLSGRNFDRIWPAKAGNRVALPLAADQNWYGLLILDLVTDGALIYRGIQESLTRRYRERFERQILLTRTINEGTGKRIEQEKMKALTQLLSGITHEINTPLGNAILASSFVENKIRNHAFTNPDSLAEGMLHLHDNLEKVASLVNRFKEVAVELTLDKGVAKDLGTILEDLLPSQAVRLKTTGIDLTWSVDSPLGLSTSPQTWYVIINGLIQNVLNHGYPQGGPGQVRLEARQSADLPAGIEVSFQDFGAGMTEDVRLLAFQPFFTTSRTAGRTGLGLSIIYNQVVQGMGGTIECESQPDQGSLFRLRLPRDPHS